MYTSCIVGGNKLVMLLKVFVVCALEVANENSLQKSGDVQSGPSDDMISRIGVGSGIGTLEASGFIVKKISMLFLDNSSAVVLHAPGDVEISCKEP